MLKYLKIENFLIIENQELNFHDQYNVIIGETGSGKSIILKALAFVLGKRLDSKIIRPGCDKSTITAEFDLKDHQDCLTKLTQYEIEHDNNIIIRRIIKEDGSSKIFLNSQIVSNQVIQDISENLIEIQTQHEKNNLYNTDYLLQLIDRYHADSNLTLSVKNSFLTLKEKKVKLEELYEKSKKIEIETNYYKQTIKDLSPLNPSAENFENISNKIQNIKLYSKYQTSLQKIAESFNNENGILALVNNSLKELYNLTELDAKFVDDNSIELSSLFDSLANLSGNIDDKLSEILSDNDNEEELRETFSQYKSLARKYRTTEDSLGAILEEAKTNLDQLESIETDIIKTNEQIKLLTKEFLKHAEALSIIRQKSAKDIEENIISHLSDLNMPKAQINIQVENNNESEWNINGINSVRFLISTNPGQPFIELKNTVSGGEMSRILLAIKLCFKNRMNLNTVIFDEIDAGIGGQTVELIAKKLVTLAKTTQIIAITHNETMAKPANLQLKIVKKQTDNQTFAQIA